MCCGSILFWFEIFQTNPLSKKKENKNQTGLKKFKPFAYIYKQSHGFCLVGDLHVYIIL